MQLKKYLGDILKITKSPEAMMMMSNKYMEGWFYARKN